LLNKKFKRVVKKFKKYKFGGESLEIFSYNMKVLNDVSNISIFFINLAMEQKINRKNKITKKIKRTYRNMFSLYSKLFNKNFKIKKKIIKQKKFSLFYKRFKIFHILRKINKNNFLFNCLFKLNNRLKIMNKIPNNLNLINYLKLVNFRKYKFNFKLSRRNNISNLSLNKFNFKLSNYFLFLSMFYKSNFYCFFYKN
jgi:hypothetical protein